MSPSLSELLSLIKESPIDSGSIILIVPASNGNGISLYIAGLPKPCVQLKKTQIRLR
ncbi:hypothetical protein Hanom_Chr14g01297231 [Helianthus anomalus]